MGFIADFSRRVETPLEMEAIRDGGKGEDLRCNMGGDVVN